MTELPPEMLEALQTKEKAQMKHSWMYSFMPAGKYKIYLVGYCKICNNSVSSLIPTNEGMGARVSYSGIPKWGCIPEDDYV